MSNKRYIQVSSAYRNRNQFPGVSKFEIPLSQTGNKITSQSAIDPIIDAYPCYEFKGNFIQRATQVFNGGTNSKPILNIAAVNVDGFYNGYQITDTTLNESRNIVLYDGKTLEATLDRPFSSTWVSTDSYTIQDPSIGSTTKNRPSEAFSGGTASSPQLNAAASAVNGYYNGMTITDTTLNESRIIEDYNSATNRILLSTPFSGGWVNTDTYTITPTTYTINVQPIDDTNNNPPSFIGEYYAGDILEDENLSEFRTILSYSADLHQIVIDAPFSTSWSVNDNYSIRKARPATQNTFVGVPNPAPNYNIVQLQPAGPTTTSYVGFYLYPRNQPAVYYITSHDLATNIVFISPSPASSFLINSDYDILQFSRDNLVPMTFTGTPVGPSNYEIELINLVLPNVSLVSGSRVSFYPYFYVEFTNSKGSLVTDRNIIYSNNPNATKQLFIAPTTDISSPLISKFIKLDGSGMVQTVRFCPYDNLYFAVTLPNGEDFVPVTEDNLSPLPPRPELQITATFSIKRL